jgi:hypothetical protein
MIPLGESGFFPVQPKIPALSAPTKAAPHGAMKNGGSHLKALVALHAVELLFVAGSTMHERLVEPSATFDGGVLPHQMIFLVLKHPKNPRGNVSLQSINRPEVS